MYRSISIPLVLAAVVTLSFLASAQSEVQKRTLVVNDQRGEAVIYSIDGKSFIALETIARIVNGSVRTEGEAIIVTLPGCSHAAEQAQPHTPDTGQMSDEFSKAAIEELAALKEWHGTLAKAIQQGVPGDGSRLTTFHDRAAQGLSLATIAASNSSDQNALHLLQNHFSQVDAWTRKLVQERKTMSTANYSLTPNALDNDAQYQQIANCSKFLQKMLTSGRFEDNASCH
jgi:hypothetical protein